jgi:DNA-binding TFAR19-related protein (PDSD5 family)
MDSDEAILRKGLTEEALKREINIIKKELNDTVDMIVKILELMSGKLVETIEAI